MVRKDVMRASTMLEHEEKYAVILAFDVKVRGSVIARARGVGQLPCYQLLARVVFYERQHHARARGEVRCHSSM